MNTLQRLYEKMATLFNYPDEGYREKIVAFMAEAEKTCPEERAKLQRFTDFVEKTRTSELEELYVATFDVQGACCLDVGYGVFGEDYKRGQFMAELKCLYRDKNVDCGTELPDHLPNLLRLVTRLDYGDAEQLVSMVVFPAIDRMIEGFGDQNIYKDLLVMTKAVMSRDYPYVAIRYEIVNKEIDPDEDTRPVNPPGHC